MEKIRFNNEDKYCYKEVFDNGLEVYLVPLKDKKNYFINYFTTYGSEVSEFIPNGENEFIKVPDGVAHFLEHKLFETEDEEDPFSFFSKSGTDCNACTSYDFTRYHCSGTKNFNENLKYLINLINSPYFTDKNVEKEKGIIAEELKMYEDVPDFVIDVKLRECLFKTNPRRIDVGGTVDSINKITKEDLYLCYNNFYAPNNMYIVISGNFDKDETIKIIKDLFKDTKKKEKTIIKEVEEQDEVFKDYLEITNKKIVTPKVSVGVKFNNTKINIDKVKLELYLNIINQIKFGKCSLFKEYIDLNNLCKSFYTYLERSYNHTILFIESVCDDPNLFIKELKNEFKKEELLEEDFNRIKKVLIADQINLFENIYAPAYRIMNSIVSYNNFENNILKYIKELNYKELLDVYNIIDFNNISVVKMTNNK